MLKSTCLAVLFFTLALLTSCQETEKPNKAVVAKESKNTFKVLTPRKVVASPKALLEKPYLRDVLPDSAYIYARIPNIWSLAGGAVGNVFDKALGSKPYVDALSSAKEGFEKEVIPALPDEAKALTKLFLFHATSPIEVIAMTPVLDQKSLFPNVLATVSVNFKDIDSFRKYIAQLVEKTPAISIEKPIRNNGIGEIKIEHQRVQIKLDLAMHRVFMLSGMKLKETSLMESLKTLKPNTTHAMKALESDIDSSGQGLFIWADPQRLLTLANALGAQKDLAPLAMLGINSIKNIALGTGTSKGINHTKFIIDMPKTGFRGLIPTVKNAPSFTLAGKTNLIATLGLPNRTDFISIESSLAAMSPPKKMQEYFDGKRVFSEKAGLEIEDIFEILGQDISIISDESGMYTAVRLNDAKRFNTILAGLVKSFHLNHEIRTISGQEYHHLAIPSFDKLMMDDIGKQQAMKKSSDLQLFKRFFAVPSHLYWQQENDYLILASVPQTLMDRHYISSQTPASEWFEKQQRMSPEGALLMLSMRNKGVPASMYRARLALLSYLGDVVNRPVDLFALPTVHEANLPKKGAYGVKLSATENQLALELSFESNPLEVLFAGNSYAGFMMTGILASIAMPAYEDYTIKVQVQSGLFNAYAIKSQLEIFKLENGHYPSAEEVEGLDQSTWRNKNYHIKIDSETGNIVVSYTHGRLNSDLRLVRPEKGKTSWECSSELKRKYLPLKCK